MPAEDSLPGGQDPRDAWWAAREAAYQQRQEIRQENKPLRAEARERAREDDSALDTGIADVVAAVAEHGATDAADARSRTQADGFADIWDAFTRLRDSLGLPGTPDGTETAAEPADQVPSGPVSAALLEDAMAGARASAAWYRDSPEWQRITLVTDAARALLDAIRGAAGGYWSEISQDFRVRGFVRTVAARTCRTISACAGALAGQLEQASGRQTAAWRAMSLLHRTAGAAANRVIGYRPPVAEAEQIIAGLSRPRQPAARPLAAGSPAALALSASPDRYRRSLLRHPPRPARRQPPGQAGAPAARGTDPGRPRLPLAAVLPHIGHIN